MRSPARIHHFPEIVGEWSCPDCRQKYLITQQTDAKGEHLAWVATPAGPLIPLSPAPEAWPACVPADTKALGLVLQGKLAL